MNHLTKILFIPSVSHFLLGALFTAILGIPSAFLSVTPFVGALFAIGFYVGRERKQAETYYGSNKIMPWVWLHRSGRDILWPTSSSVAVAALIQYLM